MYVSNNFQLAKTYSYVGREHVYKFKQCMCMSAGRKVLNYKQQ